MVGQLAKEKKRLARVVETEARRKREAADEAAKEDDMSDLRAGGEAMGSSSSSSPAGGGGVASPYARGVAREKDMGYWAAGLLAELIRAIVLPPPDDGVLDLTGAAVPGAVLKGKGKLVVRLRMLPPTPRSPRELRWAGLRSCFGGLQQWFETLDCVFVGQIAASFDMAKSELEMSIQEKPGQVRTYSPSTRARTPPQEGTSPSRPCDIACANRVVSTNRVQLTARSVWLVLAPTLYVQGRRLFYDLDLKVPWRAEPTNESDGAPIDGLFRLYNVGQVIHSLSAFVCACHHCGRRWCSASRVATSPSDFVLSVLATTVGAHLQDTKYDPGGPASTSYMFAVGYPPNMEQHGNWGKVRGPDSFSNSSHSIVPPCRACGGAAD